jgi:putative membrane protein
VNHGKEKEADCQAHHQTQAPQGDETPQDSQDEDSTHTRGTGRRASTALSVPVSHNRLPVVLLLLVAVALAISAVHVTDRITWWLEVAPIFLVVPVLIYTARRFPLTNLLYVLIAIHAVILMVGGHYTYAQVPFGFWLQDVLDLSRNPYDRIGHFAQGFVPAIAAREVLLRQTPLRRGGWLFFIVASICLAISACYEFIEWFTAVVGGGTAEAFLGTQGDVWDTQWDMLTALIGAITAQLTLSRVHDHALARLAGGAP